MSWSDIKVCTVAEANASLRDPVTIRSGPARKVTAEYLAEHDPALLDFFKSTAAVFGPAEELTVAGHPGLRDRLKATTQAIATEALAAAREALK